MSDMPPNGATQSPGSGTTIPTPTRLEMYSAMWRARVFEQRAYDLFMEGIVKGTTHLGLGQEAVAAGFAAAMRPDDMTFCTYRGHNHTLLRGAPMAALMGELAGRSIGYLRRARAVRCTSPTSPREPWAPTPSSAPTFRWPPERPGPPNCGGTGPGVGVLLRRRHHQHRGLPRSRQPRGRLEAAGRLRVREQPLHGVHPDLGGDPRGAPRRRPGVRLRAGAHHRRRQRRRRRSTSRLAGHRAGPCAATAPRWSRP